MQVYALNVQRQRVFIENAKKEELFFCIECGEKVAPRGGHKVQRHFYHIQRNSSCSLHKKSFAHIQLQRFITSLLGDDATEERPFKEISRIADVAWEQKKIIFEVQCSSISYEEIAGRMKDYHSIGWRVVFLFHDIRFQKSPCPLHPHYFFHETMIYDRYAHLKIPILISLIDKREGTKAEKELPLPIQERIEKWDLFTKGDLIDQADTIAFPKKHSLLTHWRLFFYALWKYLIQRSCSRL